MAMRGDSRGTVMKGGEDRLNKLSSLTCDDAVGKHGGLVVEAAAVDHV